jgi:hypothetical protein
MQVVQAHEQFPQDDGDVLLRYQARTHQVRTAATRTKLHNDPQIGPLEERPMVLGDEGGIEFGQDGDLLNDVFDLVFGIFDVDDLDRDRLARTLIDTSIRDNREGEEGQVLAWASCY